jgi:glycosyltransferase involved in cell wall biosynthesis
MPTQNPPKFSIITPSFRQPEWLRLCLSSVADQEAVSVEHIVQDNCSGSEVESIVRQFPGAQYFPEQDKGMYDAVNRGLRRAQGDICAYLNCDEQYLPNALLKVSRYFDKHPHVQVLFTDAVVTGGDGSYICNRQVLRPYYYHTKICQVNTLTCSTFFRRSLLDEHGMFFNPDYRALGDADWILRLLSKKIPIDVLREATSTFTDTGDNMSLQERSAQELEQMRRSAPWWARRSARLWVLQHRLRKLLAGLYKVQPFSYSIYTRDNVDQRKTFTVDQPSAVWKGRVRWDS